MASTASISTPIPAQRAATGREAVPLTARLFRPRVFLYTALWAGIGVLMLAVLATRGHLDLRVAHSRNPTFVTLSDGSIRNTYDVTVANRLFAPTAFTLGLAEAGGTLPTGRLEMRVGGIDDGAAPVVEVPADRTGDVRVFVTAPPGVAPAGQSSIVITVENPETGEREAVETVFIAP
ncbi:MAG: FixG Ig-like domain-containing protein [Pseudomonadota bacterium]